MAFSSSFPNPFSSFLSESPMQKTMDDVWKDISLSNTGLQSKPFSKHQEPNSGIFFPDLLPTTPFKQPSATIEFSLFPSTSPKQRPTTALSLSSAHQARHRYKKRTPESIDEHERDKRMIKNREAAARSRARKQAYIEALELRLSQLIKENAELRKELQQSHRCLRTCGQVSVKSTLHRTSTAPF